MKKILFVFIALAFNHCKHINHTDFYFQTKKLNYLDKEKNLKLAIPKNLFQKKRNFYKDSNQIDGFYFSNENETEYLEINLYRTNKPITNEYAKHILNTNMVSELKVIYPKNKLKILEKKIDENNNSMQLNIDYLLTDTKGRNFYGVSSIKVWSNISAKIKFFKKLESENNVKMEKEKIFFATNQISIF